MHFRHERYYKTVTLTANDTWSDVLPTGGLLDHILATIRMKNNNAQYSSPQPLIHDHVTKIEVKGDGKEPFKDYWGQTCLFEYAMAAKRPAPGFHDVMSGNYQTQTFPILFGRYPFDGEYALDLSRPSETRIDITNDVQSDDYDGATLTLDVDLWFLEEPKAVPANYFQTYEKTSNTWTAAEQENTFKVPTKDLIRRMYLGCESARTSATDTQANKAFRNLRYLKYTHMSGGLILRDDDLYRHDQDVLWGEPDVIETQGLLEARTDYYVDTMLCRPEQFVVVPAYSADPGATSDIVMDQRVERFLKFRRSAVAGNQARFTARGTGYMDHLMIDHSKPDSPDGYLNPADKKEVEILVGNSTSGGSSGKIRFILQTLKSQPPS